MGCRPCWVNCWSSDDDSFLEESELVAINALEDSLAPLDENTIAIRQLITGFEACYHEADKEAERIVRAIGSEQPPKESSERPPQRKRELENCRRILSAWCEDPAATGIGLDVGGIAANDLLSFIGQPTRLKIWQVRRIVERITEALDPGQPYHRMALDLGDYGEPGAISAGEHFKNEQAFLNRTTETIIHDTVDGQPAQISLAFAIDLLMPCHWDFALTVATILKAVGEDLHPKRPLALCSRNLSQSLLCERLKTISNTLRAFCDDPAAPKDTDACLLSSLIPSNPQKHWLAASLDKTIRLQLEAHPDIWLTLG